MILERICENCRLKEFCSEAKHMPIFDNSKNRLKCKLYGGYGNKPVSRIVLGADLQAAFDRGHSAVSIVDVPSLDHGVLFYKTVRMMHPPLVHDRSTTKTVVGDTNTRYK